MNVIAIVVVSIIVVTVVTAEKAETVVATHAIDTIHVMGMIQGSIIVSIITVTDKARVRAREKERKKDIGTTNEQ